MLKNQGVMTMQSAWWMAVLTAVVVLSSPLSATGQSIRDFDQGNFRAHLPVNQEFDVAKGIPDFVARGDRLYVLGFGPPSAVDPMGAWRVFIYDVRDRSHPRLTATAPIASEPGADFKLTSLDVNEDYLYMAGEGNDLFVFDISKPELPVRFVRTDALIDDVKDKFDVDLFGFNFSKVKAIKYRRIIIEDGRMYVLFDFAVDTDLFLPKATTSSVAVIEKVDTFPFRIQAASQTGTQTRQVLLNNLADAGDDIKSFDYEAERLFLGFDEQLSVVEASDPRKIRVKDSCGSIIGCLRELFFGGDKNPYRDLVANGDFVYIVFEDGLLVKRVESLSNGELDQREILQIDPSLNLTKSDGFDSVFVDDDKVYLGDRQGSVLVLDKTDTPTPGVVGAIVNASSVSVAKMDENWGDLFLSTDDNGLFILTAFGFSSAGSGGGGGGGGGCTIPRGSGKAALWPILLPLALVPILRRWSRAAR